MEDAARDVKACAACGGELRFVQEVLLGDAARFFGPDPARADLYLCVRCGHLEFYESLNDLSLRERMEGTPPALEPDPADFLAPDLPEDALKKRRRERKPEWEL